MARADKLTITRKKQTLYRDFLNNFNRNPYNGTLAVVENEDAIGQALRNLFLTGHGERFMNASYGGDLRHTLFELLDQGTIEAFVIEMKSTAQRWEPRAEIIDVRVSVPADSHRGTTGDHNAVDITIVYKSVNTTEIRELNLLVRRTR